MPTAQDSPSRTPASPVVLGDANTDAVAKRITARCERFDLVIDDGSHLSGDIVRSFCRYFDHVTDGGPLHRRRPSLQLLAQP